MTRQKDLKKLTRARMEKTGESYTTARAQLVAKRPTGTPSLQVLPPPAPAAAPLATTRKARAVSSTPPPDYAALAGMSDAVIRAKTGCGWQEWVEALDYRGASEWSHRAIAECVGGELGVPAWWSQAVTVGYERIKGLRAIGQQRSGEWEANRSRTFPVPIAELFRACSDGRARRKWLAESGVVVRKSVPERSLRLTWSDGGSVELWFTAKGPNKSAVAIQHRRLPSQAAADERKAYWGERLDALADHLGVGKR
jgi:uncharacterized protein YndB with AHSA1/START domain